ncbi:MAG: hypothetical protein ACOCXJ_07340, partial [Planctomycetota bacterium]
MRWTLTVLLLSAVVLPGVAAVSDAVQEAVVQAQEAIRSEDWERARSLLGPEWPGGSSAERQHLLGLVHQQAGEGGAAESAWRRALALDPGLQMAGRALLQSLAGRAAWQEAAAVLPTVARPDTAPVELLELGITVLREAGDIALAEVWLQAALARFPQHPTLRQHALALALLVEDAPRARLLLWQRLQADPADAQAWRDLAALLQETDPAGARAALQAALLLRPEDRSLQGAWLQLLLAAGQAAAGLDLAGTFVQDASDADRRLAAAIALAADEPERARDWMQAIPAGQRSRADRLLLVRAAVRSGDTATARGALEDLLAAGAEDPALVLWAAHLAAEADDHEQAELLLRGLVQQPGPDGDRAALQLGYLLLQQDRREAAR